MGTYIPPPPVWSGICQASDLVLTLLCPDGHSEGKTAARSHNQSDQSENEQTKDDAAEKKAETESGQKITQNHNVTPISPRSD